MTRFLRFLLALTLLAGCAPQASPDAAAPTDDSAVDAGPVEPDATLLEDATIHHRLGAIPPYGTAGSCDASPGTACGTYPTSVHLANGPSGAVKLLAWNGDGGYKFVDGGGGGGAVTSAVPPLYIDAGAIYPACGTIGQVLRNGPGTTGVGCGNINLALPAAVSNTLAAANGGTGIAGNCSGGQVVMGGAGSVDQCLTPSGDTTISTAGVTTTGSLNGASSGGITEGATTGMLTAATGATAPGLTQSSTTTSPGATSTWQPQPCVTTSPCTSGWADVDLTAPVGAGSEVALRVRRSTQPYAYLGAWAANSAYSALTMGPNITPSGSSVANGNYTLLSSATAVYLGSPNTFDFYGDGTHIVSMNGVNGEVDTGFNFAVGIVGGGTFAGGSHVIQLVDGTATSSACTGGACLNSVSGQFTVTPGASTSAQFAVSTTASTVSGVLDLQGAVPATCSAGNACLGGSTGDLSVRGPGGTLTHVASTGDAFAYLDYATTARTGSLTASGGTGTVTWGVPSGYVCFVHAIAIGNQTSGTAGAVNDIWVGIRNHGGVAAKIAVAGSAANPLTNLGTSGAIEDSAWSFGSNGPITAATASGASLSVTVVNNATIAQAYELFFQAACSSG